MIRFVTYAFPLLLLLLALFGFAVEVLDLEPRSGAVIRLAILEQSNVPATLVLGAWIMEACGLLALFLLAQGRCGTWWLDGLVAGWLAWVFRGPLLVLTIVVAARQPQDPWWDIAFGWWILYSVCGLAMAVLARRSGIVFAAESESDKQAEPATAELSSSVVEDAEPEVATVAEEPAEKAPESLPIDTELDASSLVEIEESSEETRSSDEGVSDIDVAVEEPDSESWQEQTAENDGPELAPVDQETAEKTDP